MGVGEGGDLKQGKQVAGLLGLSAGEQKGDGDQYCAKSKGMLKVRVKGASGIRIGYLCGRNS